MERSLTAEMKNMLSAQGSRLVSELDHLKAQALAFEEGIREQINASDESVFSYKEQLGHSFTEARKEAEISFKTEIGKYSIASTETVKQYQRELEAAQEGLTAKLRELDTGVEDARRRVRDLSAETDSRIASVRSSVEDAERHIREAIDQTKLIDKADALRLDMGRKIEDLKGDIDRLDQKRVEAAQLENDFVKIKRLEDDVNAKMTRFLSEKRRIETMETDFNRLLQMSKSVEEKLSQVTDSNDTLQGIQLQIRKLEEALGATEEKYQRIERKNQILDNTNDGIDRNFRILQESEKISGKIGNELDRYAEDLELIKKSIEKLVIQSEKAGDANERIAELEESLEEIEDRTKSMQRARQWIADAETRLEDLNKQAQTQARAIDAVVKGKKSHVDLGGGAPPMQKKENAIALAKQGWKVDEIAKALKISRGEVELILEMAPKD
jgi:chromosome segregation ATPase